MSLNGQQIKQIIFKIAQMIDENKMYLTELDAAIGDGDHGINMSKGFQAVIDKIKDDNGDNIGDMLKKVSMALIANVGGASGPLYGTAFMKAGMWVGNRREISIEDYYNMLLEALNGIKARGRASIGEKTMVDSLEPAINELKISIDNKFNELECLEKMVNSAKLGMENTKNIVATKGRASYLGERSIGHLDPGAVSCYLILKTIFEEVKKIKG